MNQIWQANWYFTCIGNTWDLITGPPTHEVWLLDHQHMGSDYCTSNTWDLITGENMNKITPFSDIATNTQNVWNSIHSYLNLAYSQMPFYKHEQCTLPDNCTKQNHHILCRDTFYSDISQALKMYEKIGIITQIWHTAKIHSTYINSPWCLITIPNMKKIQPATVEACVRMDRQTHELDPFLYSTIPLKRSKE